MKHIQQIFFILLASLALTACNEQVELEGGVVPAQYMDIVTPLTGSYGGIMENGEAFSFEVVLDEKIVRAQLIDDFLGSECKASLGILKRVEVRELENDKIEIERAVFAFNPNNCAGKVEGRELELARIDGVASVKYEARVQSGSARLFSCEPSPTVVGGNATLRQSAADCNWVSEKEYLRGEIAKTKL